MNRDYSYCSGKNCRIKDKCKRYDTEAFKTSEPLWWTSSQYKNGECVNFEEK